MVTYDVVSESNIPNFLMVGEHDHEDTDTLLILHCHDVAKGDPFLKCVVCSPDTDVFLLLFQHFPELTPCTLFLTAREIICVISTSASATKQLGWYERQHYLVSML